MIKNYGKLIISGVVFGLIAVALFTLNTASGKRALKDVKSEYTGGLKRVVTVYDQDKVVKQYKGKLDVKDTEYGNKVVFELEGKRIAIYNATVIVEEE